MYNVTTTFLNKITQNSRKVSGKLLLGTLELTDEDIISMDMEFSLGNDSIPAIGGVVASRLEVKLFKDKLPTVITTQELKPSLGLETSPGIIEYIPMGVFRVSPQDLVKTDKTIRLIAYDTLFILEDSPYITNLVFPATLSQIKTDLTSKGLRFKTQSLANITIKEKPGNIRELLSDIGELLGMNVVSNRLGEIEFRKLNTTTFSTDNYNNFKLLADDQVKLTRLTVEKEGEDNNLTYGNDAGFTIKIKNDSITTENELTTVYNRIFPISYTAYECNLQGLPHVDVGDIIALTDRHGVERNIPIAYHKISYSGGLRSEIRANAPSGAISSTGSTGSNSITQSLNDLRVNILEVNHVLADKISTAQFEALEATIGNLQVDDLTAIKAYILELEALNATVAIAEIQQLSSTLAEINTLLAGNLKATNLQAGLITSTSGLIANLAITNAMIKNMNADKLTAGKIKTNLVEIGSESGNFIIADNTLQIQDGTNVRVQIGKDASGDYSLSLWDIAGKLMFDARGLTEDAIKDEIIRNDMIATDANISGDKIDIGSVVRSINNGVTKLESSSILYDGKSLNIAFNELETNFNDLEIGGRNLLVGTEFKVIPEAWMGYASVSVVEGSPNSVKVVGDAGTARGFVTKRVTTFEAGEKYTISFEARTTNITSLNYNYIMRNGTPGNWGGVPNITLYTDGDWHKYSVTFNCTVDRDNAALMLGSNTDGTEFEVRKLKLEKGNKATDWLQAPEDVQTDINTRVKTTDFTIEQGKIATLISDVETIEGEVDSTSSKVSTLEQTVGGFNQTVSELATSVNEKPSQWFYAVPPTLSNAPYNTWTTTAIRDKHINDLYTDTITGYAYRFIKTGSVYSWAKLTDKDLTDARTRLGTAEGKIITTDSKLSTLEQNVDGFKQTVSSTYTTKTEFDNLEIGGRNLAIGTAIDDFVLYGSGSMQTLEGYPTKVTRLAFVSDAAGGVQQSVPYRKMRLIRGEVYTLSFEARGKISSLNYVYIMNTVGDNQSVAVKPNTLSETEFTKVTAIFTKNSESPYSYVMIASRNNVAGNWLEVKNIKVEKGNKATDWTPAPEDVDATISTEIATAKQSIIEQTDTAIALKANKTDVYTKTAADGRIDSKINTAKGEIKVTTDAITSRVESTETEINKAGTGLKARVTSAESKITDTAIVNTVKNLATQGNNALAKKSEITQTVEDFTFEFARQSSIPSGIRYIRISQLGAEEANFCYWGRLEVFSKGENIIRTNMTTTANFTPTNDVPHSAILTANTAVGHLVQYNNKSNDWMFIEVDMGKKYYDIDSLRFYHDTRNRHYYEKIQVSSDGLDWHDIYNSDFQGTILANTDEGNVHYINASGSSGITKIDDAGIRVSHGGTNQYSEMRADGFVRKWEYGEAKYLNDVFIHETETSSAWSGTEPEAVIVSLPTSFRGRGLTTKVVVATTSIYLGHVGAHVGSDGRLAGMYSLARVTTKVVGSDFNAPVPYVLVKSHIYFREAISGSWSTFHDGWHRCGFSLIAVGG